MIEMTDEEWGARQELAACYRIFAMMGWDEAIFNHITVKVPGEDGAFLINPYGLHFSEVKASNLVKIDIEGNKLDGSEYPGQQGRLRPAQPVPQTSERRPLHHSYAYDGDNGGLFDGGRICSR